MNKFIKKKNWSSASNKASRHSFRANHYHQSIMTKYYFIIQSGFFGFLSQYGNARSMQLEPLTIMYLLLFLFCFISTCVKDDPLPPSSSSSPPLPPHRQVYSLKLYLSCTFSFLANFKKYFGGFWHISSSFLLMEFWI